MVGLGTLRTDDGGSSYAYAVSADGAVVVGEADRDDNTRRAFRWDAASGKMTDLGTLRADNGGYSYARAVSADGAVVVGYAEADGGVQRAFIWRTQMQDYGNVLASSGYLANDTELAVAEQQAAVDRLMGQTCLAQDGRACMTVGGWLADTGDTASQDIGSRGTRLAVLGYGRGVGDRVSLGGTLSLSGSSLDASSFDMGNAVGGSLWVKYNGSGASRTGLQADLAFGWARESGDITRGRDLENVMPATGESDLVTTAVQARLGYGLQRQDWLVTPSLTLARYSTSRDGYAETGSDFNSTYDDLSADRTTVTLSVAGAYRVSELGTLLLDAGLEHDFDADPVTLTGTGTVPDAEVLAVDSTLDRRTTRGFVGVGYSHDLGGNRAVSGALRIRQPTFGSAAQASVGVNYNFRF